MVTKFDFSFHGPWIHMARMVAMMNEKRDPSWKEPNGRMNEWKKWSKNNCFGMSLSSYWCICLSAENTAMNWQTTSCAHTECEREWEQLTWSHIRTFTRITTRVMNYVNGTKSETLNQNDAQLLKFTSTHQTHFVRNHWSCVRGFTHFVHHFFIGGERPTTCSSIFVQLTGFRASLGWAFTRDRAENLFGHHFDN